MNYSKNDENKVSSYLNYLNDMDENEITLFPDDTKKLMPKNIEKEFTNLPDLYDDIKNCLKCPLGSTRTKFVFGVGNENAKLMFIGEAPGRDEDLKGIPFVGRAGQLLDKILSAISLSRDDVYIANILKCRPPNNRDPLPAEIKMCMSYLLKQMDIIKPKLLCCLGRISAQILLETDSPMNKLRGQIHTYRDIPLIATYHPAALLRNESFKKPTWEDMKLLKKLYDDIVEK